MEDNNSLIVNPKFMQFIICTSRSKKNSNGQTNDYAQFQCTTSGHYKGLNNIYNHTEYAKIKLGIYLQY